MKIIRGDTYKFKFQRLNENNEIIKNKAEEIWFTVKENYNVNDKKIQKKLSTGEITFDDNFYYHITIDSNDTSKLKYGTYVYDIQVKQNNSIRTVKLGKLKLTEEVTFEV